MVSGSGSGSLEHGLTEHGLRFRFRFRFSSESLGEGSAKTLLNFIIQKATQKKNKSISGEFLNKRKVRARLTSTHATCLICASTKSCVKSWSGRMLLKPSTSTSTNQLFAPRNILVGLTSTSRGGLMLARTLCYCVATLLLPTHPTFALIFVLAARQCCLVSVSLIGDRLFIAIASHHPNLLDNKPAKSKQTML